MKKIKIFIIILLQFTTTTLLSNCKTEEAEDITKTSVMDGLCTVSDLKYSGGYRDNGDYVWKYMLTYTKKNADEGTYDLVCNAGTSPFRLETKQLVIKGSQSQTAELDFVIPASSIPDKINIDETTAKIDLRKDGISGNLCSVKLICPLPEHPRLLVRKGENIKQRYEHADFNEVRKVFQSQLSYSTDGTVKTDKPDENIRAKMEALALSYLMDPNANKDKGNLAITTAINYLSSYSSLRTTEQTDYNANTNTYEAIFGAALVYDWCYKLMTPSQKQDLIKYMKAVCKITEYGIPDGSKKEYLSGHYGEFAPTISLAMGVAIFDEEQDMFKMAYNEQTNGFAPSRNLVIPSGTHHQGAQYIHVRGSNELMQHFILSKLNSSPYDARITQMTYRDIYGIIPQKTDMDGMEEGDCHNHIEMGNSQLYYLSAGLSEDPYLQDMSRRMLMKTSHQSARLFVYYDPFKTTASIENAPKSRYFPSPSGLMIARTAWDIDKTGYASDAMVVLMNMREYAAQNHTHMDVGHFSIYYKGQMALDAGIYQGSDSKNGWGKENYVNYYTRTIAHNSLLINDPDEPKPIAGWDVKTAARDGGQFFKSSHAWNNAQDMISAGKSATVLAHEIGSGNDPDYTYLKGDMTEAYKVPNYISANYPSKVDAVKRSFLFLNHHDTKAPGTLIVLDKIVSTNKTFKKTWLLHTQNQPQISGNIITAQSTQGGRNGKLVTAVLLPETANQSIQSVGGSGKEYWVDGKNYGSVTQEDAGKWRIELSPKNESLADNFLNVIQAMETTVSPRTVSKALSSSGNYVAIEIGDYLIAENLNLDTNKDAVSFKLGESGKTYKIIVTDLEQGNWKVKTSSGTAMITASADGVLTFSGKGGSMSIEKQ